MGGSMSKPHPSRSLEVIGASYARTGTSSMQLALEKLLDGPVWHGGTNFWLGRDDANMRLWALASDANFVEKDDKKALKLIREAIRGYVGAIDVPVCWFMPEFLEIYPDSKVVLTVRDPVKWWESYEKAREDITDSVLNTLTYPVLGIRWIPHLLRAWEMYADQLMRDAGYDPSYRGPEILTAHNESMMKIIPRDRLLVMGVQDGWEPLAKFLNKPVLKEPFPLANERAAYSRQAKFVLAHVLMVWAGVISVAGGSMYVGWRFLKH